MTYAVLWVTTGGAAAVGPGAKALGRCVRPQNVFSKEIDLARNQYSFEKRRREIAKKKKKEEKRQRKLEKKNPQPEAEAMELGENEERPVVEEETSEPQGE